MERTLIAPGVHLSCDPAEKFNRCRISIHFAFPEDTIITVMLRYMNPIMFPTIRILTESNMLYERHASIMP